MKIKKRFLATLLAGLILAVWGCGSNKTFTDPTLLLAYNKEPNEQTLDNLAKNYATVINKNRKTGVKQGGLYSDYAVALAKQGKRAEANNWFNKEMAEFPSSRQYVIRLKQELIPEYVNDNTIRNDEAPVEEESSLSPATRAAAEERAASVMEESAKETEAILGPEEDVVPEEGVEESIKESTEDETGTEVSSPETEVDLPEKTSPETPAGEPEDSRQEEEELKETNN